MTTSHSRLQTLVRTTGAYTSVTLLRAVMMVAILPILTRLLPASEYALIALLTPMWWIGQSVLSLGASEGIARAVLDRSRGTVAGAYLGCVAVVLVTTGVAAVLAPMSSQIIFGLGWSNVVLLTLVLAAIQSLVSISAAALRGQRRVTAATVVMAVSAAGTPIFGLVGAALAGSAEGYTAGMCCAASIAALIGAIYLTGRTRIEWKASAAVAIFSVRLGLPGLPQAAALLLLDAGLRRATLEGHGYQAVAIYGLASVTGGLLWTVVRSAGLAWGPEIYSYKDDAVEPVVREQVRLFVAVATILAGLGVVLAPVASSLLLPESYPTGDFVPLVAVFLTTGVVGVPFMALLQLCYRGRLTAMLPLVTIPAVAIILATVWLLRSELPVELIGFGQPLTIGLISVGLWVAVRRRTDASIDPTLWLIPAGCVSGVAVAVALSGSTAIASLLGVATMALGCFLVGKSVIGKKKNA